MNEILKQVWPFIIGLIFLWFVKNEILIFAALIIVILITFKIEYSKNEFYWLIIGIIFGILLELGGDYFYKLQTWSSGMLFGIPIWLPLLWGYVFVIVRRIGN
ncbi:hypothetical protein GF358_02095, partial [Candidatus Woesearchaeota archaeon]|nr:hypothetical protein [Candidatus Woesearchaeota archaeon]